MSKHTNEDLKIILSNESYHALSKMMDEREYKDYTEEMVEREFGKRNNKFSGTIKSIKGMSLSQIEAYQKEEKDNYRLVLLNHSFKIEKEFLQKLDIIHFYKKGKI